MKVTTRIIADVEPSIKEMLQELAKQKKSNMTEVISNLIKIEHAFHFGGEQK